MTRQQVSDNRWRLGARFELFEQLGTGAVGTVWRARDLRDGGEHAVKVLRPELVSDPQAVAELYGALGSVARIGHAGIVAVDDAETAEGWLALRSRLVSGESLRSMVARQSALNPATAAQVVATVCDAVAAAHAAGHAHGDLHPGNILLSAGGGVLPEPLVTDFGLAALANRGQQLVPPIEYRAPESVAAAAAVSAPYPASVPSADVYALGILLYECLTGQTRPVPAPGRPDELWSIIVACLAGDPRYRPTAGQLAAALRSFANKGFAAGETIVVPGLPSQPYVAAPQPAGVAMTTVLPAIAVDEGAHDHGNAKGSGKSSSVRLPRLITAHKTESGIAAAVVVVALLIGGALTLGGGGAAASTANARPTTRSAPATTAASESPEAVVLPVGSASPSPSASPSATAPVQVTLINARSNTCMDTAGRIFADGTKEDIWSCNGTPAQSWTLTPAGQLTEDGGAYCLDDYGLEKTPGTRVVLWSCNGGANQRWTIQPNGTIVSANAGLCVDVSGKGTNDGTALVLWPCDGSPSQQWGSH
ncbi:serine/threonine protein kinase [Actinocrinis sp.]|uniref:serine/threonine protein kinase n=1 Tax=Actinocrinis sp. TaxID=1920516 RepID=UPI002C54D874|nr:serine/threonine protein kinase [Actinocrinis sp.]HXR74232.1 serine/threonine protein kinase [Actinocrinis sp.]